MFTLFLIGNIASGKSTASRHFEMRGARVIDLDAVAKSLYVPGSDVLEDIAGAFGDDVLDDDGALVASRLAARAFASQESVQMLNHVVYPYLLDALAAMLQPGPAAAAGAALTVVEISNACSFGAAWELADEVLAISAPLAVRRARALGRGMDGGDFDARAAIQPSEAELCARATSVLPNEGSCDELTAALDDWLSARGLDRLLEASDG